MRVTGESSVFELCKVFDREMETFQGKMQILIAHIGSTMKVADLAAMSIQEMETVKRVFPLLPVLHTLALQVNEEGYDLTPAPAPTEPVPEVKTEPAAAPELEAEAEKIIAKVEEAMHGAVAAVATLLLNPDSAAPIEPRDTSCDNFTPANTKMLAKIEEIMNGTVYAIVGVALAAKGSSVPTPKAPKAPQSPAAPEEEYYNEYESKIYKKIHELDIPRGVRPSSHATKLKDLIRKFEPEQATHLHIGLNTIIKEDFTIADVMNVHDTTFYYDMYPEWHRKNLWPLRELAYKVCEETRKKWIPRIEPFDGELTLGDDVDFLRDLVKDRDMLKEINTYIKKHGEFSKMVEELITDPLVSDDLKQHIVKWIPDYADLNRCLMNFHFIQKADWIMRMIIEEPDSESDNIPKNLLSLSRAPRVSKGITTASEMSTAECCKSFMEQFQAQLSFLRCIQDLAKKYLN